MPLRLELRVLGASNTSLLQVCDPATPFDRDYQKASVYSTQFAVTSVVYSRIIVDPYAYTLNHQLSTPNPQPSTRNPQPSPLNPHPSILHPAPSTLNPQP